MSDKAKEDPTEGDDSTDWATREQIQDSIPHAANDGVPVGIHIGEGFHWYDKGHMLTVGSFRQGKDVALILPALLSDGLAAGGISVVCLDQDGEYAAIAAPHLIQIGYNVHVLNPLNIPKVANLGNSCFNPLDCIEPISHNARELYDVLAMALYTRQKPDEDTFFDHRCRQYISLYLSFSNYLKEGSFHSVYIWLTYSDEKRRNLLEFMLSCKEFDGSDTALAIMTRLNSAEAEFEEHIYKAIEEAITVLKDKQIRASLATSDFTILDIVQRPTAVFICVPFDDLPHYAPWIRMILSFLLRMSTKRHDQRRKVVVVLDEVSQLDYMAEIFYSWTVLTYRNVTLWLIVQHCGQLKMIYGELYETFTTGATIKHWFSTGEDTITADYIASRMPQALTIIGPDCDDSPKGTDIEALGFNHFVGFTRMVCEIADLELPVKFDKVPYWELPFSRKNAPPNPYY